MFNLYCINNEGSMPLMLVKYGTGSIALSRNVPITCKVMFCCSFWPFNGHLLFIKCVCVWACV